MFVKFDVDQESFIQTNLASLRDERKYYVHKERLFLLVLRNRLTLARVCNRTLDANIGWDEGTPGFVENANIGKRHSKMTVYRVANSQAERKLSDILEQSPRE